ncbi:MAG: response regulator [Defluviitaleaceae bacterium]|nr:response regulator [Defluviitaleaceae bacterium]
MDGSPTVLIIDDTPMAIFSLSQKLLPICAVKVTTDGYEGLKIAQEHDISLILLDIFMPIVSGFEVLERLKQDERTRDIPVVLISGTEDVRDEEYGYFLGAKGFIKKPFDEDITQRIAKYILR